VEEDLERIRRANLSEEKRLQEDAEAAMRQEEIKAKSQGIGLKDVLAMTIAIFSLILPYLLGILVVCAAVLWYFLR
jgi:hypothetical protein